MYVCVDSQMLSTLSDVTECCYVTQRPSVSSEGLQSRDVFITWNALALCRYVRDVPPPLMMAMNRQVNELISHGRGGGGVSLIKERASSLAVSPPYSTGTCLPSLLNQSDRPMFLSCRAFHVEPT